MLETSFFLSRQCSWFQPLVFSHSFLLSSNLYASFTSFINNYLAISEYLILQYLILSSIGMSKYHFIVSWVFFQSSISYDFLYNYVNLHDLQYLNILVFSLWFSLLSVSKYHFVVSWVSGCLSACSVSNTAKCFPVFIFSVWCFAVATRNLTRYSGSQVFFFALSLLSQLFIAACQGCSANISSLFLFAQLVFFYF
jgi:hypothetical protein